MIFDTIKSFNPFKKKFPDYIQFDQMDCGPTCLRIIAKYYGRIISREHIYNLTSFNFDGVSIRGLLNGAEAIKLRSLPVNISFDVLRNQAPLPCIAYWRQRHFVVVYEVTDTKVYVSDPASGLLVYKKKDFLEGWISGDQGAAGEGLVILIEPTPEFQKDDLEPGLKSDEKKGLKFLWPYLTPHRSTVVRLILGLIIATIIQLILPFLSQSVVDYGINYQNISFINLILIAQLVLFISRTTVEIIRDWLLLHLGSRISITILSDFLIKMMKLPIPFFESRSVGDILQRIQDHRRLEQFLSEQSLMMLFSVFNLLVFGIVLLLYDFWIFFLYLAGTVLYILWVLIFMKKREKVDYMRFDQMSNSQSSSIQIIQGMSEIKLNNSEKRRRWEWEETQVKFFKVEMKNLSLLHIQRTGGTFISELKNILLTYVAAKGVIDGQLTLGTMISIQYIIGQLNNPIRSFIDFIMSYQNARISLDRISDIHNQTEEDGGTNAKFLTPPETGDINIDNLSFRYKGANTPFVLEDLNLIIPKGKVTAIVGVSGSGKTTLMKLLLKVYPLNAGSIKIGNINLADIDTRSWRQKCGVVMQDGFIFSDTILRNITESDSEVPVDRKRLSESVRIANLEDLISSLPNGFNALLSSQGGNLSGGQRQRMLIARAIYKNPEYLFFDEATSALDANNERTIMENLEQFYQNRTVVIIAHRLSTVKNADQIIVLEGGKILEIGHHDDLVRQKGKYYSLVKNQLELGS